MKKLLHIVASPREDISRTLQISEAFLEKFKAQKPDWVVEELNLPKVKLPDLGMKTVSGKYVLISGKELFGEVKEAWKEILAYIEQFKSADGYLISSPMWNFSIPYMLKHYIDVIVQPRYLFQYTDKGIEGLVKNKKMLVIGSYGGEYTSEKSKGFNFHEPYLRAIFGFVGITDITFVIGQPMDSGKEKEQERLKSAIEAVQKLTW
jgi:FMN-dependent NADH-azoreductase